MPWAGVTKQEFMDDLPSVAGVEPVGIHLHPTLVNSHSNWPWTQPGLCPGDKTILLALGTSRSCWSWLAHHKAQFLSHLRDLVRQEQVGAQMQDPTTSPTFCRYLCAPRTHHVAEMATKLQPPSTCSLQRACSGDEPAQPSSPKRESCLSVLLAYISGTQGDSRPREFSRMHHPEGIHPGQQSFTS